MGVANTIAYNYMATIMVVKGPIVQTPQLYLDLTDFTAFHTNGRLQACLQILD
jgi:hypothetical protein